MIVAAADNFRIICFVLKFLVAMAVAVDHPSRFQIDKHRFVVRRAGRLQDSRDLHFERVLARDVQHVLAVRQERVARR